MGAVWGMFLSLWTSYDGASIVFELGRVDQSSLYNIDHFPNLNPPLSKTAERQVEAIAETQKEFFDTLTKMNERWLSRATAEARLATDLGSKLSSARSVPDAVEAYQQWMTE
jgi:hypothetical protein